MRVATAPDGTRWKVRRLWLPRLRWRPRFGRLDESDGALIGSGADDLAGLAIAVVFAIVVVVLGFFVLPYIVLVLELLVLPLLLAFRIVFRRPFTVQARSSTGETRRWKVVGWRDSGDAVEEVASALERGREPALPQ